MTNTTFVAIDIAKVKNDILVEFSDGKRRKLKIFNRMEDFLELDGLLRAQNGPCIVGVEPTSNYHRPISYFLKNRGYDVRFVPSIGVARTREALHNSWDKNDPKDAQVILALRQRLGQSNFC